MRACSQITQCICFSWSPEVRKKALPEGNKFWQHAGLIFWLIWGLLSLLTDDLRMVKGMCNGYSVCSCMYTMDDGILGGKVLV